MTIAQDIARQINAAFGEGAIVLGSDIQPISHWATGVLPFDSVLDGGLPVGRFTEVYGDYSTLKSFIAYKAIAEVQALGGITALVDTERAYDVDWAASLGVDTGALLIKRAETGEEAIGIMEVLIRGGIDLLVWDSIAASQPKQYAEHKPGEDLQVGGQARMMSAGLRRLNSVNDHTAVLCINQTRVNVGMTYGGARDSMPGGRAMPYYASYRIRLTKAGQESVDGEVWTGERLEKKKFKIKQKIKVTVEKWKLNAPIREVWLDFDLRSAQVDEVGYLIGWAIEQGYVQMSGNGNYVLGDIAVRGRDKFIDAVANDSEMLEWLKEDMTKGWLKASPGSLGAPPKKKVGRSKSKSSENEGQ